MNIRTSQDAALVSCCDCQTPECDAPRIECESLSGTGYLRGFVNGNLPHEQWYQTLYKKLRQEYADGGHWYTYEWNTIIEVYLGGKLVSEPMLRSDDQGGPFEYHQPLTETYSDGLTFPNAVSEMAQVMEDALDWDDPAMTKGDDCVPKRVEAYVEFTAGGYRPQDFSLTYVRYRVGVPEGYSTEDSPRSVYQIQWDEVIFPEEWNEWKERKDAYDHAKAEHTAWEQCEQAYPGECGIEPEVPENPGAPPSPAPSLLESKSWDWSGSMEEPWSAWFDMSIPETPGEIRRVNMLVKCFHDSKRGVKPTAHGEVFELD